MNRIRRRLRVSSGVAFWALAGVALLVSHDAIWLTQTGPGQDLASALRTAGHGYWGLVSLGLALVGVAAAIGIGARLWLLRRRAASLNAQAPIRRTPYLARAVRAWLRLFAIVAIGFVIQENVEHFFSHQHTPGIGALIGPEYPLALPVIAVMTTLAAFLAAAVATVERQLVTAIIEAWSRLVRRAPQRLYRPPTRVAWRLFSPGAGTAAGRAPPRQLAFHS